MSLKHPNFLFIFHKHSHRLKETERARKQSVSENGSVPPSVFFPIPSTSQNITKMRLRVTAITREDPPDWQLTGHTPFHLLTPPLCVTVYHLFLLHLFYHYLVAPDPCKRPSPVDWTPTSCSTGSFPAHQDFDGYFKQDPGRLWSCDPGVRWIPVTRQYARTQEVRSLPISCSAQTEPLSLVLKWK